jgi:hypothetical protein
MMTIYSMQQLDTLSNSPDLPSAADSYDETVDSWVEIDDDVAMSNVVASDHY